LRNVKRSDILEPMQGHTACQPKPALFRSDQSQFLGVTAAFPEGGGAIIYIFLSWGNPVKFTDPDGKWTFSVGLSGNATYGIGVQGGAGIAIGYSKDKGFSFGVYAGGGANFGIPPSAGFGVTGSFSLNTESVRDLNGASSSMGVGIGAGPGFGVDVATDENGSSDPASGVSLTMGIKGTPLVAEGHLSTTGTITASTSVPEIAEAMNEAGEAFKDYIVRKIVETIPQ
jgi:hypothetical protein